MSFLKPTRRMAVVKPPFDDETFLMRLLTSPAAAVRYAGIAGLSRYANAPRVRLALKGVEKGDTDLSCRLASKRVLDGNWNV